MRERLNKLFKRTLKPVGLPRGCKELDFGAMFCHASKHVGIRPVTYEFPQRIYEFSKSLDEEIDTFLASVDCDKWLSHLARLLGSDYQGVLNKRHITGTRDQSGNGGN